MEAGREQVESWKQNPWKKLPTWAKWTIGVVGAFILLGIGAAIGSSEEGSLKSEVKTLKGQLATSDEEREEAASKLAKLEGLRGEIIEEARRKAARIKGSAVGEANRANDKLASLKSEVSSAQAELEEVEGSIGGAEHKAALSTIGNGIWQAEVDYIPGTYRAPGGSSCYWATLNSADPQDIASNEIGSGPQIATIETPYFQTDGCGTWERIE